MSTSVDMRFYPTNFFLKSSNPIMRHVSHHSRAITVLFLLPSLSFWFSVCLAVSHRHRSHRRRRVVAPILTFLSSPYLLALLAVADVVRMRERAPTARHNLFFPRAVTFNCPTRLQSTPTKPTGRRRRRGRRRPAEASTPRRRRGGERTQRRLDEAGWSRLPR